MKNLNNPLKADPTRTATLRRQFENEMVRRFARFRRKLVSLIVDEDAFGLRQVDQPFVMNRAVSSTQLNVTDPECLRLIRELQGRLDPTDVIELEDQPHVTVRYGLTGQDPEVVRELVANVFCSTGEGGGVDASCSLKGVRSSQKRADDLFQSASVILQQRGWDTEIQHAGSTSSSYMYVGKKNEHGGFTTEFKIRIANHPKPGWRRSGWIKELKTYDLRPKTAEALIEKILAERIAPKVVANVFCKTGEGGGVDPTCSLTSRSSSSIELTLYRAADDDSMGDSTSFSEDRDVAEFYLNNPGFGGKHIYKTKVEIEERSILDLANDDDPERALFDLLGGHPSSFEKGRGVDEIVPMRASELREKGILWVKVPESHPPGAITWIRVDDGDEPEMKRLKPREQTQNSLGFITNIFCSTGEGGGVDPSCSSSSSSFEKRKNNLAKIGYRLLASGTSSKGLEYEIHGGSGDSTGGEYLVLKKSDLKEVGKLIVSKFGAGDYVTSVRIDDEFQRQGIGTVLYETVEKDIGRKLVPSPKSQTPQAEQFWKKRMTTNSFGPVWMTLGRLSLFQHPDQDVLYLSVESKGLERLNAELGKLPNIQTHDEYIPHLTIAYLKPGTGWKYLSDPSFLEWQSYAFTELTFSDRERWQTGITLNVFCPTGEGGGVDATCSPGGSPKFKTIQVSDVNPGQYYKRLNSSTEKEIKFEGPFLSEKHAWLHSYADNDIDTRKSDSRRGILYDKQGEFVSIRKGGTIIEDIEAENVFKEGNRFKLRSPKPVKFPEFWKHDIEDPQETLGVQNVRWAFRSSPEKIKEFLKWLEGNLRPILTDEATTEDDWWNKYVMAGFKKGAARSYDDMKKAGAIPKSNLPFYLGQKDEFLKSAFRQPESVEKVKLLAGRVYTELKGVTEVMSQNLTRTLTDGLTQGMNPRQIATNIVKDVNGIGIRRARVIARTEIIRAHAEGQLDSMERLGVKQLAVMVEWSTAGDDRVCKLCQPLEGIVVTVDEAKGLIPRHPQCRCAFIPANVGEDQSEQVRGAARIKKAITKSLVAGKPKRGKSKSSWAGANRKISSFRPKSRI